MKYQQVESKANVLVVNKDRLAQKSLYEMLCRSGYVVDAADCAEEALTHLDENPCRVILTDVNETGIELLNVVKKREYPSQVVILTSYGNIESAVNSMKIGAFDYLVRPVEDKKIITTIQRALTNIPSSVKEHAFTKTPQKKENTYNGLVGSSPQSCFAEKAGPAKD